MKALISPNENVNWYIATTSIDPESNTEITELSSGFIPNSGRIAQIEESEFEVGGDLFWVDCNTSVNTSDYYYDSSDTTIKAISDYTPPA